VYGEALAQAVARALHACAARANIIAQCHRAQRAIFLRTHKNIDEIGVSCTAKMRAGDPSRTVSATDPRASPVAPRARRAMIHPPKIFFRIHARKGVPSGQFRSKSSESPAK
jgi:transposase